MFNKNCQENKYDIIYMKQAASCKSGAACFMSYSSEFGLQLLMQSTISAWVMCRKLPVAIATFKHAALYTSSSDFLVGTLVVAIFEFFLKIPIIFPPLGSYPAKGIKKRTLLLYHYYIWM